MSTHSSPGVVIDGEMSELLKLGAHCASDPSSPCFLLRPGEERMEVMGVTLLGWSESLCPQVRFQMQCGGCQKRSEDSKARAELPSSNCAMSAVDPPGPPQARLRCHLQSHRPRGTATRLVKLGRPLLGSRSSDEAILKGRASLPGRATCAPDIEGTPSQPQRAAPAALPARWQHKGGQGSTHCRGRAPARQQVKAACRSMTGSLAAAVGRAAGGDGMGSAGCPATCPAHGCSVCGHHLQAGAGA